MTKCPLTDEVIKAAVSGISKVDTIIGADKIPTLEIDEWCNPSAKGINRMNLGQDKDNTEHTVVHEYGHIYLNLKLGSEIENIHSEYIRLALLSSFKKIELLQKPACGCNPDDSFQLINKKYAEYERKNKYILSMHEYFADMLTIITFETAEVFGRNFRKKAFTWPWEKGKDLKNTDTHHSLEGIWSKSYEMAKSTFGDNAKKQHLINKLIETIQEDISKNLVYYTDNSFEPDELSRRLTTKLFR